MKPVVYDSTPVRLAPTDTGATHTKRWTLALLGSAGPVGLALGCAVLVGTTAQIALAASAVVALLIGAGQILATNRLRPYWIGLVLALGLVLAAFTSAPPPTAEGKPLSWIEPAAVVVSVVPILVAWKWPKRRPRQLSRTIGSTSRPVNRQLTRVSSDRLPVKRK